MSEPRVCLQFAAIEYRDEATLAEARRLTHDRLIDGLGDRRRSGVRWREATGETAIKVVQEVEAKGVTEYLDGGSGGYGGLIAFLRECPDAVLVIAEADVEGAA